MPANAVVENAEDGSRPKEIVKDTFLGVPVERVRTVNRFARLSEAHPP